MATLRAARTTYKNTKRTTDAYFMRILRKDDTIVRITNATTDISMTDKVLSDGTTEALGQTVTYSSATNYNLTATNKPDDREPGGLDFDLILDKTTTSSTQRIAKEYTTLEADQVTASTTGGGSDPASTVLTAVGNPWFPDPSNPSNTSPAWIEFDFRMSARINRIDIQNDETVFTSIRVSDDGQRYDEVTPLVEINAGGGFAFTETINLPKVIKSRFVRVYFGAGANALDIRRVRFYYDITYDTTGTVAAADIENGLYANAEVFLFMSDFTDAYEDDEKVTSGYIKNIAVREGIANIDVLDKMESLNYMNGRVFQPSCDAEFGSFRCGINIHPAVWSAGLYARVKSDKDASSGTWLDPDNGYFAYCSTEGLTSGSEPTWPTSVGATVADNVAVWTMVRAFKLTAVAIDTVTSLTSITISEVSGDAADTWANGKVIFTSGALDGTEIRIKSQTAGVLTLNPGLINLPAVSDTVTLIQGCRKRITEDCDTKFDNVKNFQGFPYIPGAKIIGKFGGQE